jgi:hypothetical protein
MIILCNENLSFNQKYIAPFKNIALIIWGILPIIFYILFFSIEWDDYYSLTSIILILGVFSFFIFLLLFLLRLGVLLDRLGNISTIKWLFVLIIFLLIPIIYIIILAEIYFYINRDDKKKEVEKNFSKSITTSNKEFEFDCYISTTIKKMEFNNSGTMLENGDTK